MHLKTLQGLLVLSALAWALFIQAGAGVFAASLLLCVWGAGRRTRAARALVAPRNEELGKALTPEAVAWVNRFSFFYVWREEAVAWGTTLKMASLLMLLLAPWIILRALISGELHTLVMLVPAVVFFFFGVTVGARYDIEALVNEDAWKKHKPLHEDAARVLALKEAVGQWPPSAAP